MLFRLFLGRVRVSCPLSPFRAATDRVTGWRYATHEAPVPLREVFNAFLGAGSTDAIGYSAAFGMLLAPCALAALLATRARST